MGLRRLLFVAATLVVAAAMPATVLAVRAWQVGANPSTLTAGASTDIRITVRNTGGDGGGDEIACVQIQVPANFDISGVGIVSVHGQTSGANYSSWQAVWAGAGVVAFKNPSDTAPLIGRTPPNDVAVFRITGTATNPVTMTWTAAAADKPGGSTSTSCGSGTFPTSTLLFVVLPAILPPTPTPTPTPAPTPTPTPTPAPPSPTPVPSVRPTPTPAATPTPPPGATAGPTGAPPVATEGPGVTATPTQNPEASASPAPSPQGSGLPAPTPGLSPPPPGPGESPGSSDGGTGPGLGGGGLALPGSDAASRGAVPVGGLGGAVSTALESLPGGLAVWAFPAFVMSVPGLLLLLAVGAQAVGALAWLPVVRKRLGAGEVRRSARR